MIGGFIVTGANAKRVVLRGLGPSLTGNGVTGALSDPVLQLFDSQGVLVETNDNCPSRACPATCCHPILTSRS